MHRHRIAFALILVAGTAALAQQPPRAYTIQELFTRNVGSAEQQIKQFPPHKIIGNVYYVGTESLSSFLVTTPAGHILIDSVYERTVPTIQDSVQKLGFKFEDIKIQTGMSMSASNRLASSNTAARSGPSGSTRWRSKRALNAGRSKRAWLAWPLLGP